MAKKVFTDESLATFVDEIKLYTDEAVGEVADSVVSELDKYMLVPSYGVGLGQTVIAKNVDSGKPVEWIAVDPQSDWNQNDPTNPDYIKNKPFGESLGGDTLIWDGNTDGLVSVNVGFIMYKISDAKIVRDDIANGFTIHIGADSDVVSAEDISYIEGENFPLMLEALFYIPTDNYESDGFVIPKAGWYHVDPQLTEGLIVGITIPGYTGFPSIKKIDSKYLPNDIARIIDVDLLGEELRTEISAKADEDHTHPEATINTAGLMSAEDKIQLNYGGIPIVTTSGTGAAYTAAVDGMVELKVGMSIVIIPHTVSTATAPTLNVNSLGAKAIRRMVSNSTTSTSVGYNASWLAANKPIRVTYNGTFWIADLAKPAASDISGTVSVANGGIGKNSVTAGSFLVGDGANAMVEKTPAEALAHMGVTATAAELNYVDGVTSNVQTQLDTKLSKSGGNLDTGAKLTFTSNRNNTLAAGHDGINIDMSRETASAYSGNIVMVKDPTNVTTTALGYHVGQSGLMKIFMGGTYSDPAMYMDKDGQFRFRTVPVVGAIGSNPVALALQSDVDSISSRLTTLESSVVTTHSGAETPISTLGEDGDLYLVTE